MAQKHYVAYLRIQLTFFFKQKTAYEIRLSLVGSEMCIRDRFSSMIPHPVGKHVRPLWAGLALFFNIDNKSVTHKLGTDSETAMERTMCLSPKHSLQELQSTTQTECLQRRNATSRVLLHDPISTANSRSVEHGGREH